MKRNKKIDDFLQANNAIEIERFIERNLEITEQIYTLLNKKGWSQKELAEALGKTPAEVSRWLNGQHNLTLRTITKMEAVLGEDIILTPQKAAEHFRHIVFVKPDVYAKINEVIPSKVKFGVNHKLIQSPQYNKQIRVA